MEVKDTFGDYKTVKIHLALEQCGGLGESTTAQSK